MTRSGIDFDQHRKEVHDPFDYIGFLYYLHQLGENDFSSNEHWCWNQYQVKDTKWIPNQRTKKLDNFKSSNAKEKMIAETVSKEAEIINKITDDHQKYKTKVNDMLSEILSELRIDQKGSPVINMSKLGMPTKTVSEMKIK